METVDDDIENLALDADWMTLCAYPYCLSLQTRVTSKNMVSWADYISALLSGHGNIHTKQLNIKMFVSWLRDQLTHIEQYTANRLSWDWAGWVLGVIILHRRRN
jgi:hypothetical protein